eukprot:TRINITY_DN11274_c0_g1_i1.p1 TRINITY_DN11274_c0_g1~~TRINITY_DN11274_c0_g1_i1.p1  ORF type:complete len:342 (+),score=58.07 TRINITY_DN11274_c0_g1_i1:827-1852(+)
MATRTAGGGSKGNMAFLTALKTSLVLLLNIGSVIGIVILNKKIFTQYAFDFPNTLMAIHFLIVTVGVWAWQLCTGFDLGDKETRPSAAMLGSNAALHVASVMFVNMSLLYNSVGSYQILKLANIPVMCVLEYYLRSIRYSFPVLASLAVLLMGVGLTTTNDVTFNLMGITYGAIATVATAGYQISVKDLTKGLNSMQSLYFTAPIASVLFTMLIPLFDNVTKLYNYKWTPERCAVIGVSGMLALVIQFTVYVIIGKTSPVTYQVIGHTKTLGVLACGFLFFDTSINTKNLSGMITAMLGVIWYTQLKRAETAAATATASSPRHQYQDTPTDGKQLSPSIRI